MKTLRREALIIFICLSYFTSERVSLGLAITLKCHQCFLPIIYDIGFLMEATDDGCISKPFLL